MKINMFKLGKENKIETKVLLNYLRGWQETGLCDYLCQVGGEEVYNFFREQPPFEEYIITYPVEFAVLGLSTLCISNSLLRNKHIDQENKSSKTHQFGQLRRWWCYNLAVAISQGKL